MVCFFFCFFFSIKNDLFIDNDATTWSPQGRLYQVEYAMEAVKQGSVAVGIVSKTHAVLCALKVRQSFYFFAKGRHFDTGF